MVDIIINLYYKITQLLSLYLSNLMASITNVLTKPNPIISSTNLARKATIDITIIYKKIIKCVRSKNELKKGELLNGRYIFLKYLGRGSFGKVIKAKNILTNEIVAIKITENNPSFQRHALQEIKTLTEIEKYDPNNGFIVKMHEYFY